MIEVHTSSQPARDAAEALTKKIKEYKNKDILLLFSGGSSLGIIHHIHPNTLPASTTLSVLDERFTFEKNESNFSKLAHMTFFKHASKNGIAYIDPQAQEDETLEETAKRFDLALKHWHITHKDGVVLATVGIGSDGHTAGILPLLEKKERFDKLFLSENLCAVGYEVSPEVNPHTKRITTTLTYIRRHLSYACIYATGIQKKDTLEDLLKNEHSLKEMPAEILKSVPESDLFTDMTLIS